MTVSRYQAVIEYDGTDFLGFQRQAQGRTVQGELERALREMGWTGKAVLGAGRTDAGVHASGQVIAFDLAWAHDLAALVRAFNAHLPPDVSVRTAAAAAADFHPRFRARARRYRYLVHNAPVRSALRARTHWFVRQPLALEPLNAAAGSLVGTHDFAAFGSDPDHGHNTVRTVSEAVWRREGETVSFEIQADAFLFRMVRSLTGALKQVGAGERAPEAFEALLRSADRALCPPPAPAHGLCLIDVIY